MPPQATLSQAEREQTTLEREAAFTKALPFAVIPTNIPGAYTSVGPDEGLDPNTASTAALIRNGLLWRRPGATDRPAVVAAWQRAFARPWLAKDQIKPYLIPRMGKTHLLGPVQRTNTGYTSGAWAGGMVNASGSVKGPWVSAIGTWNIPTVSQPTEAQGNEGGWNSSSWVGIDGFSGVGYIGSNDVLQAGVQQHVDAQGNATYVAWVEWFAPGSTQGSIQSISNNKVTLGDTTPLTPAIASLNGLLYLAWRGDGNDNLNLMVSSDNGRTFGGKFTSPETSTQAPALTVNNGVLFIAWKGDSNDNLNVASVNTNANGAPTGFANKVTVPDTSPLSPALASLNGSIYLAWKGDGNDNLNVSVSTDGGKTFGNKMTSPETSPLPVALAANNGQLYIAWKGDGNDNLNVAVVDVALNTGFPTGFSNKLTLGETSPRSPALAALNGFLFLSWKGDGNDNLNVIVSGNNGQGFGSKFVSPETSPLAPALTVQNGSLFIAWKGDGNDNMNIAPVQLSGFAEPAYVNQTDIANFPVNPGDSITCSVQYIQKTAGHIYFTNQTTGQRFSVTFAPPAGATFNGNCVEWIMEAPDTGYPVSALPKFTSVNFTEAFGCSANNNTTANPQNGDTVNMVNGKQTLTSVLVSDDAVSISFTG
jgi:hypothetical protein